MLRVVLFLKDLMPCSNNTVFYLSLFLQMSMQEQARRYDIPEKNLSSPMEVCRGNEKYNPFDEDDDEGLDNQPVSKCNPEEQSRSIHQQKPDTSRMTNGYAVRDGTVSMKMYSVLERCRQL